MLLIDETDKADVEMEGLLLEVLSDFQVTVPELGTGHRDPPPVRRPHLQRRPRAVRGAAPPLPVPAHRLPEEELERRIVRLKVPGLGDALTGSRWSGGRGAARDGPAQAPSVAETVDWARTLLALGAGNAGRDRRTGHLGVILRHQDDIQKAAAKLDLDAL